MRQVKPMQHVGDGGQRLHHDAAGRQRRFDLPQRDPSLARHDGPQVVRVLLQQGTPVAPNLRWRCAAGLAHPLHQLDGRRGAHGKAAGRLPDRAATLDNSHDPLTQVLGQRCGHDQLHRSHPQHPGSRTLDSVQARTALTWPFYLLSLHPGIEERVVQEIGAVTKGGTLREEHVEALSYTRQVVLEAMRLYPPAPVVARTATRDVSLGAEMIRAGSPTYIPIYAVQRHRRLWDEPDTFDPDRFAPEAVKARHRYAYLPFGAGPRICIGMSFALSEAVVILATLLRGVRLSLRPSFVPELKQRVTLRPAAGMPMRIQAR